MNEAFLHYIWEQKLFSNNNLLSEDNKSLEIIHPGKRNNNAGPDFLNARIKIDDTVWAGNVEIHIKSSDWYHHNHQKDKAYNNVILHVVEKYDREIYRQSGEIIPTLSMKYDKKYAESYMQLNSNSTWIPCENFIKYVDPFITNFWLQSLVIERLSNKTDYIKQRLSQNNNNWEETFYQLIARNFGFKLNSDPFEMLSRSTQLKYLLKHRNSKFQIEALLFGQAGFLNEEYLFEDYYNDLRKEYKHLKEKFKLEPMHKYVWKFSKSRPVNFPTIRIAQFASLLNKSNNLFSHIIECGNIDKIRSLLDVSASEYWDTHYHFDKKSGNKIKNIGKESIDNILINTVIPFIFLYGKEKDNEVFKDKAVFYLENIQAERNSIIEKWNNIGIIAQHSSESQALLQLKNIYCNNKRCLNCQIGNYLIKNEHIR